MFEKYIGRKTTPKVTVEAGDSLAGTKKGWVENAAKDPRLMKWFVGSVVSDSNGNPIPVFHGTRGNTAFKDVYENGVHELGMHFGSAAAASERLKDTFDHDMSGRASRYKRFYEMDRARLMKSKLPPAELDEALKELDERYAGQQKEFQERLASGVADGEKIYPVFLKITNPVRLTDPGSFSEDNLRQIKKDLIKNFVTRDQVRKIEYVRSIDELRTALIELGYDGVVYRNGVEGREADSYIPIVSADQIRPAFEVS